MDDSFDFERMIAGDLYRTEPLIGRIVACRELMLEYNALGVHDSARRHELLRQMLGEVGEGCVIVAPFHCDYGTQISLADGVFINYDCTFLDCGPIRIGERTLIGPQVGIYTALHPIDAELRAEAYEFARGVEIGRDVWIGGHATILPGVSIGDEAIVGAGSVVTRDVAPRTIVAGNPARVLREIADDDREEALRLKQAYLEAAASMR